MGLLPFSPTCFLRGLLATPTPHLHATPPHPFAATQVLECLRELVDSLHDTTSAAALEQHRRMKRLAALVRGLFEELKGGGCINSALALLE